MGVPVDQQVVRGAAAILSWQYYDTVGEPADPGTVTIGITRADGTVLQAPGGATAGTGADPRTFALTAAQTATLDLLLATWTRVADSTTYTTLIEIVGGFYFDLATIRASDAVLADDVKYDNATLQTARGAVEDEFEGIANVAFVPRYSRQALHGTGCRELRLPVYYPRRIRAVSQLAGDGTATAWSASQVDAMRVADSGIVHSPLRVFPAGFANLVVAWEYGRDRPPAEVRNRALMRLRYLVTQPRSAIPDRAETFQNEGGTIYRLSTASWDGTGVPDIDAVLDRVHKDDSGF